MRVFQTEQAESLFAAQCSTDASRRIGLVDMIRDGFSVGLVENLVKALDLSLKNLSDYGVIAPRTLTHSRQSGKFSPTQSDRLARFFRIFKMAQSTFGNPTKAKAWLTRSTRALRGRKPVNLLDTEEGARLVEDLLHRIDHGLGT